MVRTVQECVVTLRVQHGSRVFPGCCASPAGGTHVSSLCDLHLGLALALGTAEWPVAISVTPLLNLLTLFP